MTAGMRGTGRDRPGRPGRLVVISGPSGSGKSTLVQRLLARPDLRLTVSVSATTRAPRPGEVPGRDYFFLTPEEFEAIRGELLESAVVHGHHYGTPAGPVRRAIEQGFCVALVIDVQGGFQVREKVPDALLVFIQVPSLEMLEARLRARGTDSPDDHRAAAGHRPTRAGTGLTLRRPGRQRRPGPRRRGTRRDPDPERLWSIARS